MFKLLADTSTSDLLIALIKNQKCIDYIYIKNLLKKTDVFPKHVHNLLKQNNLNIKNIDCFYCTNGPGSFTGSRTALIFFKTIVQITGSKLFILDSLSFLAPTNFIGNVVIDAKSGLCYVAKFKNMKKINNIKIIITKEKYTKFNLKNFLENTNKYLAHFKLAKNIFTIKTNYIKQPSIGEIRK